MNDALQAGIPRTKKSVALSGVVAGNTAICSVGSSGNDLHYRGYDVIALAEDASFLPRMRVLRRLPTSCFTGACPVRRSSISTARN
ncbi:MAG: 2-methylcitrate synthase [Candidatus Accumulibacter sp. BA-94]|nr:MAG: 2-methylcitrate synthase [Candidatus Accumulibacter sp. BA-94]